MKVSREFLTTLVNYKHCASKDETRPYLNTIAIRRIDNQIELTAADGYKAIRSLWSFEGDNNMENNKYYLLPTKTLANIVLNLKRHKDINIFEINFDDIYFKLLVNKDTPICQYRLLEREYPKVDCVYPDKKKQVAIEQVIFNPDFMYDIRKAVLGTHKLMRIPQFDFNFFGELAPISINVTHEGIEHRALIITIKREV